MGKPNIFNYATSELSQDAVICYLAAWADMEHEKNPMHAVGKDFTKALLAKSGIVIDVKTVQIYKQEHEIDVLILINHKESEQKVVIVIEDKTVTSQHSGQLKKNKKYIEGKYPSAEYEQCFIYYKTSDQVNLDTVKENNYKAFMRNDLLDLFKICKKHSVTNTIYLDYVDKMNDIENQYNAWKLPIKEWQENTAWYKSSNKYAWEGLFAQLSDYFQTHKGFNKLDRKDKGVLWGIDKKANGEFVCWISLWRDKTPMPYLRIGKNKNIEIMIESKEMITPLMVSVFSDLVNNIPNASSKAREKDSKAKRVTLCTIPKNEWIGNKETLQEVLKYIDRLCAMIDKY